MPGTRSLAVTGVLGTTVLATAGLVTAVLTSAVTGPARPTRPASTATAGGARGGGHGGSGTPGMTATAGNPTAAATTGAAVRARVPVTAALTGVSCPSARLCMTVGATPSHGTARSPSTVVLRWNGKTWADVPVPRPASDSLSAIWCGSATWCLAVGDTHRNAPDSKSAPLAELWDGHGWTILPVPYQANTIQSSLTGIDCTSPAACTAVGFYTTTNASYSPPYPLAEGWNGRMWRLEPAAGPALNGTMISSVSCSSASACTAVGTSTGSTGPGLVAERWNGTAWAAQHTEPSGGAGPGDFKAVSCPSATSCTVVGDSGGDDNNGLSEVWNGRSWGTEGMVGATLSGVTCFSPTDCLAVGGDNGLRGEITLAARWNGRSWSVRHTPNVPRPALDSSLGAVSCASPAACLAVGGSDRACCTPSGYSRHDRALAEWWNGTKWRMLPTP